MAASSSSKPPSLSPGAAGIATGSRPPLIPLSVVDAPTQRLWALAATGLVQAWKLLPLLTGSASLSKILLIDFVVLLLLSKLRIPRLDFTETKWALIGAIALLADWLLTGGWRSALNLVGLSFLSSWIQALWSNSFSLPLGISEHRVRINDLVRPSSHLLGQHTIHILPYSTATFSTNAPSCHCIGVGSQEVKVPIFFNNTEPTALQYSVTPFDDSSVKTLYNVTIPKNSLITVGGADGNGAHHDGQPGSGFSSSDGGDDALTWRDEVEAQVVGSPAAGALVKAAGKPGSRPNANRKLPNSHRNNQQRIFHLPIHQVGRIRLERVLDKSRLDARISRSEILVVQCPTTTFVSSDTDAAAVDHRCPGQDAQLSIQVSGLAPLQVSYRRKWQGSSPRSQPEDQLLTISHISSARIANSPLMGGSADGSNPDEALDVVLNRRRPSSKSSTAAERDFSWAIPQTEVAPISLQLDRAGTYTFEIEAVRDACGNAVSMDNIVRQHQSSRSSAGQAAKKLITSSSHSHSSANAPQAVKQIEVHPRAHANIVGCSADRPLQLLKGGSAKQITLKATNVERDAAWTASLRYLPEEQQGASGSNQVAPAFQRNVTFGPDGLAKVEAAHPGTYILDSLNGKYCSGEVGSPWSCPVVEVPSPTADITFSSIEDVCAGPVGVKALAVLSGTPPFRLQYEIRRAGQHPIKQDRIISRTREEFEFRPSTEGAVQYRFTGLADANYRGLPLDGPVFEQTVHPLAKAQFVQPAQQGSHNHNGNNKLVMRSCEGSQVKADVSLEGTGPFDLTYVVRSGSGKGSTEQRVVKGIDGTRHPLEIALPAHINAHGGSMTVSLVSIRDGKNCERSLATSDLNIEIRRVRPTAGFVTSGKERGETVLLEGKEGKLPVRLEGEGPWTVEWARQGERAMPASTTIHQAESSLVVDRPGLYSLVSVKDAFCSGSIVEGASEWMVTTRARPSVHFDHGAGAHAAKNGSLLRPGVCRGTPDSVDLRLSGHFPVEVTYEQRSLAWIGGSGSGGAVGGSRSPDGAGELGFIESDGMPSSADARERSTFSAAQESTVFQLSTEAPGWHVYELVQVGDTSYPLSNVRRAASSSSQRLEQMVYPLPSAVFAPSEGGASGRRSKRATYCVGDTLASRGNDAAAAPTVQLSGTPPFSLEFELSSVGAAGAASPGIRFVRTGITGHTVKLEVDESEAQQFRFDKPGEWKFRILSLQDGNGCIASSGSLNGRSSGSGSSGANTGAAMIEVADTADIAPVGTRQDFCVGETVEYILSGSSPWTVTYNFNGQESTAQVRQPVFSRVAEKPGTLSISSVAHNQNKCKRHVVPTLEGMRKEIHSLPTVKVTGGGNYIEDLREGGETSIVFSLSGEAPFSFTYQRLEATDIYAHPKVLETHTVAGVLEDEYVITTSLEGTWRVTWLQDRWCSVSIDGFGRRVSEGRARLALTA